MRGLHHTGREFASQELALCTAQVQIFEDLERCR